MTLSQEQINAILEGTGTYEDTPNTDANSLESFFQHLSQQGMTAGSQAVSQALGKSVVLSHPEVSRLSAESLLKDTTSHQVMIQTGYQAGQDFPLLFLIKDYDVAVIFDILMGKDGRNPDLEIGDLQISAIGEVMNQLIGAAATAISAELGTKLAMKPPASESLNLEQQSLPAPYNSSELLCVRYQLTIEGVLDSEIFELWPLSDASAFHLKFTTPAPSAPAANASAHPASPSMASTVPLGTQGHEVAPPPTMPPQHYAPPPPQPQYPPQSVQPVQFGALGASTAASHSAGSLDRILDIPLKVTVELGSSRLKVKNVLELAKGSVVELDKLSGEPVDLLVNGRLMARGEVVVVNENFGVRISEILGPEARLQHFSDGG